MQFLHLDLHQRILHLLHGFLRLRFGYVVLQQFLRGLGYQLGKLGFNFRRQRVVVTIRIFHRGQRSAHVLLDFLAIGEGNMLVQVSKCRGLDALCVRVHRQHSHNLRVLHSRHVHLNVRLVILILESLRRFAHENIHILRNRVFGFQVIRQGD
ncbi:hypothetical protein D3C72_1541460 [compost metagenome]